MFSTKYINDIMKDPYWKELHNHPSEKIFSNGAGKKGNFVELYTGWTNIFDASSLTKKEIEKPYDPFEIQQSNERYFRRK